MSVKALYPNRRRRRRGGQEREGEESHPILPESAPFGHVAMVSATGHHELSVMRPRSGSISNNRSANLKPLEGLIIGLCGAKADEAFSRARQLAAALARQPNQDQLCLELDIPDDKWGKLSICQSIESMLIMLRRKHNFEERDSAVVTGEKTIVYEDDGGYNKLYISMCPDHRTSAGAGAEGCADLGAKVNRFWHYTPFALEGTRVDPEQKLMGSAQAGGVWLGDVLTHINDQDATEMTLAEIYELLSVVRTQRPLSLTFKRYARIGLAECLETWSSRENKYIALLRTCVYVEGLLEVGEEIVGCWHVKSLNEWGRSQSRIIVLSSRSYFRVNFMSKFSNLTNF